MTRSNIITLTCFTLLLSFTDSSYAQIYVDGKETHINTDGKKITLDPSIKENADNPFFYYFKEQDKTYIQWLYARNITHHKWAPNSMGDMDKGPESELNHTLVFTIEDGKETRLDTVVNTINPLKHEVTKAASDDRDNESSWDFLGLRKQIAKWRAGDISNMLEEKNLQGNLPKGVMSYIEMNRKRMRCGVQINNLKSNVLIQIADKKGNIVSTLVDDELSRGWNEFVWKRGKHKKGKYILMITVDDEMMTQNFKA